MKRITKKFIIDVAPLTRIPLTRGQFFHYLSEEELLPGSLVQISLFSRKVEGVVLASKNDFPRTGGIELKKIEKIIEKNFLTKKQLELARFISDYYISPLGIVLKGFVPKRVRSRIVERVTHHEKQKSIILTKEQSKAVDEISKVPRSTFHVPQFLLFGPAASGKTEVYMHSILKIKKRDSNNQFLILLPEQTLTPQAMERYGAYFKSEEIVTLSSNIPKGQFYSNWQKIKSGQVRIIIGTRMAVFAPFKKLGLIVIDEEQDISFKQWDMNPRYDTRAVAEKISEIHHCPIVRGSATPSLESYYRASKKDLRLIKIPPLKQDVLRTESKISETVVVDMKKERWEKNYSCVSKKLKSELEYALKNKQQAILLVNRQGMSAFSVCEDCRTVLRCPKCDRALVYENQGNYQCLHCAYKTSIIPRCQNCKSLVFTNIGLGTQKVEKEIQELFPGARSARIDSQIARSNKKYSRETYEKFSKGEIDILIGTQMISKNWDLPSVSLVGIIDADNLLSMPDFSTDEKALSLMMQAAGRVSRPGSKFPGVVIIQTYHPENKIINWAVNKDISRFHGKEIEERKILKLAPYYNMIKIIFSDRSIEKVEAECQRVEKSLQSIGRIIAFAIYQPLISKTRGKYRKQILIKFRLARPRKLEEALKKLGSGWMIDVDPVTIV